MPTAIRRSDAYSEQFNIGGRTASGLHRAVDRSGQLSAGGRQSERLSGSDGRLPSWRPTSSTALRSWGVWAARCSSMRETSGCSRPIPTAAAELKWKGFFNEIALGTGFGLRYDISYLVIPRRSGHRDPYALSESRKTGLLQHFEIPGRSGLPSGHRLSLLICER